MSVKVPSGILDDILIKTPLRLRRRAKKRAAREEPTPGGKAPEDGPQTPTEPRSPQMDDMQKGASAVMSGAMLEELDNILKLARWAGFSTNKSVPGFVGKATKKKVKDEVKNQVKKKAKSVVFQGMPSPPAM